MEFAKMKTALEIMSQCDCLSITEDDKKMVVRVMGTIVKALREMGLCTTEMTAMYDILEISTWDNGYFCSVTRRMCSLLHTYVNILAESEVNGNEKC